MNKSSYRISRSYHAILLPYFAYICYKIIFLDDFAQFARYPNIHEFMIDGAIVSARDLGEYFATTSE